MSCFKIGNIREGPPGPQGIQGPTGPAGPEGTFKNAVTSNLIPVKNDLTIGTENKTFKSLFLNTDLNIGDKKIDICDDSLHLPEKLTLGNLKLEDLISRLEYLENEVKKLNEIIQPYA